MTDGAASSTQTAHGSKTPSRSPSPWLALAFASLLVLSIPLGDSPPRWVLLSAVTLAVATILVARTRDADRWGTVAIWPVVVIAGTAILSIGLSELPGLALERSTPLAVYLLLVPIVQILCWSPVAVCIFGGVVVLAILSIDLALLSDLLSKSGNDDVRWQLNRVTGTFGNPNDLAVAAVLLPLASLVLPDRKRLGGTIVLALAAAPSWAISLSRQALLGWLVATVAMIRPSPRRRSTLAIVGGGIAFVTILVLLNPMARTRAIETLQGRDGGRSILYVYGVSLATDHPITGIGPTLFGEYYVQDAIDGWSWNDRPLQKVGMPWVHSLPLEVLVETGVVGVFAFGLVFVGAGRRLRSDPDRSPQARRLAWVASSGLVTLLVLGLVDLSLIKPWCHIVIWTTLGIAYAVPARRPGPVNSPIEP